MYNIGIIGNKSDLVCRRIKDALSQNLPKSKIIFSNIKETQTSLADVQLRFEKEMPIIICTESNRSYIEVLERASRADVFSIVFGLENDIPPNIYALKADAGLADLFEILNKLTQGEQVSTSQLSNFPLLSEEEIENIYSSQKFVGTYRAKINTKGNVICFSAYKGGVGKSTLSLQAGRLLADIADGFKKIMVIDANLGQPSLAGLINAEVPYYTIDHMCSRINAGEDPIKVINESAYNIGENDKNNKLRFLFGIRDNVSTSIKNITIESFRKLIDAASEMNDYVIVDTSPADVHSGTDDAYLLSLGDYYVWIVANSVSGINQLYDYLNKSAIDKIPDEKILIVLNKEGEVEGLTINEIEDIGAMMAMHGKESPYKVFKKPIPYSEKIISSGAYGTTDLIIQDDDLDVVLQEILEEILGEEFVKIDSTDKKTKSNSGSKKGIKDKLIKILTK